MDDSHVRRCPCLKVGFMFIALTINNAVSTIVSSQSGDIEGIAVTLRNGIVHQFKGIPYAKPPVGPLRFKKPVQHPPWNNILNATEYGPSCVQASHGEHMYPISEDCLFLNVYVPTEVSAKANKSVMVWIYGGAFISGTASNYDGSLLALHGDVIVVTFNYRLGVLGFFSTGDSNAKGNYGLWDQIEALKWVKSNIEHFGGNPESITLFGESAGAFCVSHHAINPANKGLFHRVIMQSGSVHTVAAVTSYPADAASTLGEYLNCSDADNSESLVACLREKDVSTLHQISELVYALPALRKYLGLFLPFGPVIDGELIPDQPSTLMQNRSSEQFRFYQSLDVISGCTSAEGSILVMNIYLFPVVSLPEANISDGIPSWIPRLFIEPLVETFYNNDSSVLQHVYDRYTSPDSAEQGRLLVNLMGDTHFYTPMLKSLLDHDNNENINSTTYQFYFTRPSKMDALIGVPPEWFEGATHTADLAYLFHSDSLSNDDAVLSATMMSYWVNFAKYG
ncbi:neuroligin-3-like [Argopecten irradians]|uniref:neuroligin-3-like n=1 Tax=Argopecten irradians TaxID=31199 RepID=UPI00371EE4F7